MPSSRSLTHLALVGAGGAEDGTIVFTPSNRAALMRVSSVWGQPQPLTTLTEGEITHRFPQVLPGGGAVLYTASTEPHIEAGATLVVQPLPSGKRTIVQRGGYFGRYVASGHIVYMQDDTLFAMPFDRQRLMVTGPAGRTTDRREVAWQQGQCASGRVADGYAGLSPRSEHLRPTADGVGGPHRDDHYPSRRSGQLG